jgi:hypothetical protein
MKWVLRILFVTILSGIFFGYYYRNNIDFDLGQKIIGFHVLGGTILYLPLFLYHRWNGKSLKDYTLTPENLKRIKDRSKIPIKNTKRENKSS